MPPWASRQPDLSTISWLMPTACWPLEAIQEQQELVEPKKGLALGVAELLLNVGKGAWSKARMASAT